MENESTDVIPEREIWFCKSCGLIDWVVNDDSDPPEGCCELPFWWPLSEIGKV